MNYTNLSPHTLDIDIQEKQIHTHEQRVVLTTLAQSVAKPGCKFLEIGSWCGDSTIMLGKIAKESNGHLYCIDWWKGNINTSLVQIAQSKDIFSVFWDNIRRAGLEDVVIPIRSRSDLAFEILKDNLFDLIFVDGDHRYNTVLNDIRQSMTLIRKSGGILCGHDCEGRISDYENSLLEAGKDMDILESVHCGVVLAVGNTFKEYSINHAIWSVRFSSSSNNWQPTQFIFSNITDRRQTPLPAIGLSSGYIFQRYNQWIYAVPRLMSHLDLREEANQKRKGILKFKDLKKAEQKIHEKIFSPTILYHENFKGFRIVSFKEKYFAISRALHNVDISGITDKELETLKQENKILVQETLNDLIDVLNLIPLLVKENYYGFNIFIYDNFYYGVAQNLNATLVIPKEKDKYKNSSECFVSNALEDVLAAIVNQLLENKVNQIKESHHEVGIPDQFLKERGDDIVYLDNQLKEKEKIIREKTQAIESKTARIEELHHEIEVRDQLLTERHATIESLDKLLQEKEKIINEKAEAIQNKAYRIEELHHEIEMRDKILKERDEAIESLKKEFQSNHFNEGHASNK